MKITELRQKTAKELNELILSVRKDVDSLSLTIVQGKEKNLKKMGFLRKDIAQLKTILTEKIILDKGAKNE